MKTEDIMHDTNVFTAKAPDAVKLAIIAHAYAPQGSEERIFAQNYLIERGLRRFVDFNNGHASLAA